MRVPNISIYDKATYNLGNLTSDLQDANEVISTQKRINSISDDPIGLSQVLNLKTSIGNLDQIGKNVDMGISWLNGAENALDSVNNLILETKTEVTRLINASMSQKERKDAIGTINAMIEQIVTLGNTQINGNYIFSGLDTDIPALKYHEEGGSPSVSYNGNDSPFEIKTDKGITVPVGRDGKSTFWEDEVDINSTNNTIIFKEDNGHGSGSQIVLEATIDNGIYTTDQIKIAVRNALNDVSSKDGYGVSYEVDYNQDQKSFSIREDGTYNGFIRTEFMWESGADAYVTQINSGGGINPDDINLSVVNHDALTIDTPMPHGTEPFRLVWQGDGVWEVQNNPGYIILPFDIAGTNDYIGIDLNESGSPDITINLDKPAAQKGQIIEFDIVSAQGDHSIGHEIGFNGDNTMYAPPTSDTQAVYVTDLVVGPSNDDIVFQEVDSTGAASGLLTANIANTTYTDMDDLAAEIRSKMIAASAQIPPVNYSVSYDVENSKFNIREDGSTLNEIRMIWSNPASSGTAKTLGFYPQDETISYPASDNTTHLNITIDSTNNKIAFRENGGGILWATVDEDTYKDMAELEAAIATAMGNASVNGETYTASYNNGTNKFSIQAGGAIANLDLLWGTANSAGNSIGGALGYSPSDITGGGLGPFAGGNDMVLMTFDSTNNVIDFEETAIDGTISPEISITIPEGDYTELSDVAALIETELRASSPNNVKYIVEYDYPAGQFMIKGSDADIKGFSLLWQTGSNRDQSAADPLGFYGNDNVTYSESDESVVNITIDASNNKINFREYLKGGGKKTVDELTAVIDWNDPAGKVYTSHSQLALEVEKALEEESYQKGNNIDYSVSWDDYTKNFTIKENGTRLAQFDLMWKTGENAPLSAGGNGGSIGQILGFDIEDDVAMPAQSDRSVEWGIFNSLIDLNEYLADNDTYGIERTLGRLDTHFNRTTSKIVDIGIKYNRLEIRNKITTENNLSMTERRSNIEDADVIEAIMNMQSFQTAYQAALNSTAKIMGLSLMDYL